MSTGSVDEKIRPVLDLGDSSAAVKGLNVEVEKLLADFQNRRNCSSKRRWPRRHTRMPCTR